MPKQPATQPFRVVLHRQRDGESWVTHLENLDEKTMESKQIRDYYWGHYFEKDYDKALADYEHRCGKYKLDPYPTT